MASESAEWMAAHAGTGLFPLSSRPGRRPKAVLPAVGAAAAGQG